LILYGLDWLALALAIAWGRPPAWLAIVVTANLAAGYWGGQIELALFDLTAASLCFGRGRKGDTLAAVYICAIFVNLILWLLHCPESTTYAILGAIAWVQFGVLGGVVNGLGNSYRRLRAGMASLSRGAVSPAVARNHEPDRGGRG
jgi:hypothetical protein